MARSHSIFILRDVHHRHIEGAWTVKRELIEWLSHQNLSRDRLLHYEIVRVRDGHVDSGTIVPWEELL